MNVKDSEIKDLLLEYKKFTVYGLSPTAEKPSHYVPVYMRDHGWDIRGVYPAEHEENGFQIYQNLADVPAEYRKFINVFRASERIPKVVDELLELGGVEVLWLQLGIENEEAEMKAQEAGMRVVSDRCLIIEHRRCF